MKKWLAIVLMVLIAVLAFAGGLLTEKFVFGEKAEDVEEETEKCVLCPKEAKKDGLCNSCGKIAKEAKKNDECVFCSEEDVNKYGMCSYCCRQLRLYAQFGRRDKLQIFVR